MGSPESNQVIIRWFRGRPSCPVDRGGGVSGRCKKPQPTRTSATSTTANLVAFRGLWLFFTAQPTILVTRRRDHFVAAALKYYTTILHSSSTRLRAFSPQLHAASITATRSQIDYRVTRYEQIHFKKRPERRKKSCFGEMILNLISKYLVCYSFGFKNTSLFHLKTNEAGFYETNLVSSIYEAQPPNQTHSGTSLWPSHIL